MRHITYKLKRDYLIKQSVLQSSLVRLSNVIFNKEFQNVSLFSYYYYKRLSLNINKGTRFRGSCLYTGRYRAVINKYSCSRIYFKKMALNGFYVGLRKAS